MLRGAPAARAFVFRRSHIVLTLSVIEDRGPSCPNRGFMAAPASRPLDQTPFLGESLQIAIERDSGLGRAVARSGAQDHAYSAWVTGIRDRRPIVVSALKELIMNKLLIPLIGILTFGASWPAIAGPDVLQLQAIDHARKAKLEQLARMEKASPEERCRYRALVLPLDHGPRAQTTPYLNQLRRKRFEAEMKACKDAAK